MDKMNNQKIGIQKGINVLNFFIKVKLKSIRLKKKEIRIKNKTKKAYK